ncbi:MAG: cupin domain-containing protein [Polyangia bacterium]|jgi:transcriptional regulator with XRE-family HTH domain
MKKPRTSTTSRRKSASAASLRKTPLPPGDDVGAADLARQVGLRLRERRRARGFSLDELAAASGVSRAALSQIELCKSNPSLGVLWKIAVGLGLTFSELIGGQDRSASVLRRSDAQVLRSADGKMESRPLSPAGADPWVELYELRLGARAAHASDPHATGTREIIVVLSGGLRLHVAGQTHELGPGDSLTFRADEPHSYENPGPSEARYHDLIVYSR